LINAIARLDFYFGLGGSPEKPEVLIMDVYKPAGSKALAEFSAWFDNAHQARALRDDYAHGRWGVPGKYHFKPPRRLIDAEPLLVVVPPAMGHVARPRR